MMEKSSEIVLSEDELKALKGGLNKSASKDAPTARATSLERFDGWYTKAELKEIADGQD